MDCNNEDWRLCSLARQGNGEAYTHLYQRHRQVVRRYLQRRRLALTAFEVEDLEQEVWSIVWRALSRFRGDAAFATWLVGITKHVVHAWQRRERSAEVTRLRFLALEAPAHATDGPGDPCERLGLTEALSALADSERQVIELRYFQNLADGEIARRLRLPLGTVKGRIRSGLAHLRQQLASSEAAA